MYGISKKIYILLLALLLFCVLSKFLVNNEIVYDESKQSVTRYHEGWKSNGEETTFYNYLPTDLTTGSGISFFTKNQYIEVIINDKTIYSFLPLDEKKWEIPGSRWHFIDLSEQYAGEKITLHITKNKGNTINMPKIFMGNTEDLLRMVLADNIVPCILSVVLVSLGVIFCIGWMMYRKKIGVEIRILYVGLFTMGIGVWSGIQTQFIQLFVGHTYELDILLYSTMLLVQYPIMKYAFITYVSHNSRNKKVFEHSLLAYLIANCLLVVGLISQWITTQLFERMVQIQLWGGGILLVFMMYFAYKRVNEKRKIRILHHLIGLPLVGILVIIDYIQFHYFNGVDPAKFSRWGAIIYLGMVAFGTLKQLMRVVSMGQDSDRMKNIAYYDALTYMGNRTAFMKNIHEISSQEYENYGIAMFDLNNLKVFNDVHGHSAGDYYLIISSEIIQDIFGQKGKIFRIGGDEFCALMKDCTMESFLKGAKEMRDRLSQLKGPYTKEEMSIAYGYQQFDKNLDGNLSNTMERADATMYHIKEKLKREIKN